MHLSELQTPVPVVDLARLRANLERMAAYTREHGLALRPHVKTHKSLRVAREQVALGAVGVTCATPRECEVMSGAASDVLLAYPPVGAPRLARLMALPDDVRLTVAVDSADSVEALAAAARAARGGAGREIGVYVEMDVGMRRVGVPGVDDAVALARLVRDHAPLRYDGVMFYPGHVREPVDQQGAALARLQHDLDAALVAFRAAGVEPRVVSGGSTPAAWRMHEVPAVTEVRPGTYVYNDRTTAAIGACAWDDCALTVLATVVSTAVPGQAVIDAGTKALGREPVRGAEGEGWGAVAERPEVVVTRMSEEHGILDLSRTTWRPRVGDRVRIVPNHVCIVVHLNDEIVGIEGDEVAERWTVDARGR
jgi:D-serine deaminase-like pyridoxal phosphate-dependent protein